MNDAWNVSPAAPASSLRQAYLQTGFLVLRAVLDRKEVLDLGRRLDAEFDRLSRSPELPPDCRRNLDRCEMPAHPELAPFRLDPRNYAPLTGSPRLLAVLQALAGEDFLWHYPPMFRRLSVRRDEGLLPYHQDYVYNTRYPRLWTCFTPLSDCGREAPGLELIERRMTERLTHVAGGHWESGVPEPAITDAARGARALRPELQAGDVVVFDELTLHRTHGAPGMTRPRLSLDARAVPLSCISPEIRRERRFIQTTEAAFAGEPR